MDYRTAGLPRKEPSKEKMTVYRIEDARGRGPTFDFGVYTRHVHDHWRPLNEVTLWPQFPCPLKDRGIDRRLNRDERCGMASRKMLYHWFPRPIRKALYRHGYRLKAYRVPVDDVTVGKYQVVFTKKRARLLFRSKPLDKTPTPAV